MLCFLRLSEWINAHQACACLVALRQRLAWLEDVSLRYGAHPPLLQLGFECWVPRRQVRKQIVNVTQTGHQQTFVLFKLATIKLLVIAWSN